MRNLTIKRTKSFVGSLSKMKIYIEDPASGELLINDVPCRKIGDLKNGEEKTFQIGEQAAKVFVIADKLSKGFCNEYYQLAEGQEDVFLSGKNKFNLANGNAFRFDHNENEEVLANRKRSTRKGLRILIVAVIVGAAAGLLFSGLFTDEPSAVKTFSSEGMSITLTDEFQKTDIENYTVAYDSKNVAVFALKEPFSLGEGFENYTQEEYAGLVVAANGFTTAEIKTEAGLTYFTYEFTNPETGDVYTYVSYAYKANDAYWLIQFVTYTEKVEQYAQQITEWANSVEFTE